MAASAVSEPVALSDEGPHSISLELESKCPLADARQLLEKLINEPVRVTVLADGDAVATASLDLTPAATRGGGCIAERLQLQAMDRGDGGTATLIPTATVAVTVTLSQDAPQGGPDEGGQAPHEGETADNGQAGAEARVPFEFVKPSEAEETTVVTATAAMVGEPATLAAGATLAGGFTAQLALCWASAGVTCGVPVAFAAWTGGHLDWSEARAAVLHREHFLALRAAHVKRLPIFVELARCVAPAIAVVPLLQTGVQSVVALTLMPSTKHVLLCPQVRQDARHCERRCVSQLSCVRLGRSSGP